jgi:hypothetical protein
MKKVLILLLMCIVVGLALNVQAASVTFDPREVELTIAPGETGRSVITAHGFSNGAYFLTLRLSASRDNGNVPPEWLGPSYLRLFSNTGGASSSPFNLNVSVPSDAASGNYTGVLLPEDIRGREPLSSPGLILSIEVTTPQAACAGLPAFSNVEVGPQNIWAPTNRDVEIDISGNVSVAPGCEVTAGYTMESNNGLAQGDITLGPDGIFTKKITVNVSRSGRDKDGKVYNGTLYAVDADGNEASLGFNVTVLHDKGKKTGQSK